MEKICLTCKYLKVDDVQSGRCRLVKGKDAPRPLKRHDDSCPDWQDSGQQYAIRLGWIQAQRKKEGTLQN